MDGELAARARARIASILSRTRECADDSLAHELALLEAYAAPAIGLAPDVERRLAQAVERAARDPLPPRLWGGALGTAWVVAHLADDGDCALDQALLAMLRQGGPTGFDLMAGLVGIGIYALERSASPAAAECVRAVIDELERRAVHVPTGTYWRTPAEIADTVDGHDLGMAHGTSGVLAFLAIAEPAGFHAGPLLASTASWVRSRFGERRIDTWCNGEPGSAVARLHASCVLDDVDLEREAIATALSCAARIDVAAITDTCMCHGSAGLGHMFHRMYRATGEPDLAVVARRWLARTIELDETGDAILVGRAGVGVALAAALTVEEPGWDRLFLVS